MATEIKVPTLGESLTEGTVATWLKSVGDAVAVDEPILELETDKVTMEVNAPVAGTLTEIIAEAGAEVEVGATLGVIGDGAAAPAPEAAASAPAAAPAPAASGGGEAVDIVVPMLGESLTEGTVANWLKSVGDAVAQDEPLLELETDKVTMEVNAPSAGTLTEILADVGSEVEVGAILGRLGGSGAAAAPAPAAAPTEAPTVAASSDGIQMSPAVRKLVEDEGYDATQIPATGKDGRLTKGDVLAYQKAGGAPAAPAPTAAPAPVADDGGPRHQIPSVPAGPREERVKMTRLRKVIAGRLKDAQNTAAMLTTFNEVDMSAVMAARAQFQEKFEKTHGVRLGFMSYFVKAAIVALKEFPAVNAEIQGDEIVYKNYYDIGVAVGTPTGLVVPVLRDADQMSFADIEKGIKDFGLRARDGKLSLDEMTGGSFTITNGGIYGSMLSTPIINAPQSGILGMHNIVKRPWVVGDDIEVRPIMYLAHSYDHRIIDGRE
ncbi:MAG: 2-oxoglutarate dehydrogenase complex dihydrolipoyllysine-residue succinyltransferase, partial [Rhodospirillaceae bacterium]|nr:2-oxoglutarate dehydrogenase complex dihydrolipoyllysine-residue succinyltransferase [Rhodospirillaceae bacterium]